MSLKPCQGCGREVDTTAAACPGCGRPSPTVSGGSKVARGLGCGIVMPVGIAIVLSAAAKACSDVGEAVSKGSSSSEFMKGVEKSVADDAPR
jgi:hypothetical protein